MATRVVDLGSVIGPQGPAGATGATGATGPQGPAGADGQDGRRTSRLVVGVSTAGWTADDCDYLCDGTADNVELQSAINALPSTGGEIVLLDGTYNLAADVTITTAAVTLRGNGAATKLVFNGGGLLIQARLCSLLNLCVSMVTVGIGVQSSHFNLRGCVLDGSGATGTIYALRANLSARHMRVMDNYFESCTYVFGPTTPGTWSLFIGNVFNGGALGTMESGAVVFMGNILMNTTAATEVNASTIYEHNFVY